MGSSMSSKAELQLRRSPGSVWQGESLPVMARFTPAGPFEGWAYAYLHQGTRLASRGGWTATRRRVKASEPTVLRFNVLLKPDIPPGEYSLKVRVRGRGSRHTAGQAIQIEAAPRALFFFNLTEDDLDHLAPDDAGRREALLVSVAETQKSAAKDTLARHVRSRGVTLAVDNGGYQAMTSGVRDLERQLGRQPTAEEIQGLFADLTSPEQARNTLAAAADLLPSIFMCPEDGTLSALVGNTREREMLGQAERYEPYLTQQDVNIALAEQVIRGELGDVMGVPYAVVHALDHDMAFEVGRRAAASGEIESLASGLASFLVSQRWSDHYVLHGERILFASNLYASYHLVLQVVLGLLEGYRTVAGHVPRFHALGVGSPILMPLVILAAHDSALLSFDSSVVERVAKDGKMFSPETGQELHLLREVIMRGETWDCTCPACAQFLSQHPADEAGVQALLSGDYADRVAEIERITARAGLRRWRAIRLEKKAQAVEEIGALLAQGSRSAAWLTGEIRGVGREVVDAALQMLLDAGLVTAEDGGFVLSTGPGTADAIQALQDDLAEEAESVGQQTLDLYRERDELKDALDVFLDSEIAPLVPLTGRYGDAPLQQFARATRIEHNQIVINRLIWEARERMDDLPALLAWVEDRMARYQAATSSVYARQVEACLELVKSIKLEG
jgi:hypothetical protein